MFSLRQKLNVKSLTGVQALIEYVSEKKYSYITAPIAHCVWLRGTLMCQNLPDICTLDTPL